MMSGPLDRYLQILRARRPTLLLPRGDVQVYQQLPQQRNMAFQDSNGYVAGTARTWKSSGGTYAITCTSLAAGSSRQGVKSATLVEAPPSGSTAIMPDYLMFVLEFQHTSAPTAGGEVSLYLGFSSSATAGTSNPALLTGTDAAGPNADTFGQLVFAGSVIVSNNLGTGVQRGYLFAVPLDAYVSPVIYNNATTAFDSTAGHTILTMTPFFRQRST